MIKITSITTLINEAKLFLPGKLRFVSNKGKSVYIMSQTRTGRRRVY